MKITKISFQRIWALWAAGKWTPIMFSVNKFFLARNFKNKYRKLRKLLFNGFGLFELWEIEPGSSFRRKKFFKLKILNLNIENYENWFSMELSTLSCGKMNLGSLFHENFFTSVKIIYRKFIPESPQVGAGCILLIIAAHHSALNMNYCISGDDFHPFHQSSTQL